MLMKRAISKILLMLVGFVIGVLLCEITTRLIYPRSSGQYIPDFRGFYTLKPGWQGVATAGGKPFRIRINTLGMRGKEIENNGKPFVLCLGDSFTFGVGVNDDETYPAELEKLLRNKFQVLNGGVTGYNLSQNLARLMVLQDLRPRVVVLAVFANDWEDIDYTSYLPASDGNLVIAPRSMRASDFLSGKMSASWEDVRKTKTSATTEWLLKSSRAFELIYFRVFYYKMSKLADEEKESGGVSPGDWQRLGVVTRELLKGGWDEQTIRIFNHGCDYIERIKMFVDSWNGRLVVVYIPFHEELENTELSSLRSKLYEYLESQKFDYVDLLPVFKSHGKSKIYLPADGHLSPLGNKVTAQAIATKISNE